jgi:DNA ligase-1
MLIKDFAQYLQKLEQTASRNQMTEILVQLFRSLDLNEIKVAVYLALGELEPPYKGKKFQMGEKLVIKAIAKAVSLDLKQVEQEYKKLGDLGEVILKLKLKAGEKGFEKKDNFTVLEVYQKLYQISEISGKGAIEQKINVLAEILKEIDPLASKFIARIPLGALRLGFSDATILDALSVLEAGDKSLRKKIERAYNVSADIGLIAQKFINEKIKGIDKINIQVGIPIRMAGAERLPNAQKIIEKLGTCAVEPKYDGFRVQIHKKTQDEKSEMGNLTKKQKLLNNEPQINIYSRNLENVTEMFPDIVKMTKDLPQNEIIFEGEAIGYNPDTGEFLPFQETMQRKRKYDIDLFSKNIPLKVFVYDLLYLEGKNIFQMPYQNRRKIMESVFSLDETKQIVLTPMHIISDAKILEEKFNQYLAQGLEGVVVKKLEAPYQAGARGFHWVKLKRAMKGELADTVDCLVMGYYVGRGKRSDFGIGAILVGVYDEKSQSFKTVAKIGTGFSDDEWRQIKKMIDEIKINQKPKEYDVAKELIPDVWAKPKIVIEIQADEITKSPIHTALKDYFKDNGLALRFPRMVRFRDEKEPNQATSTKELLKLFKMQNQ